MNRNLLTATGIAIAIVILIALNVTSSSLLRSAQVDLTEDKLYTLSDGTKAVLSKLDEPITLRLYFSEKLAQDEAKLEGLRGYYDRVRELLQQYVARSGGKLTLELLDPEPFSEVEDHAVAAGIEGIPMPGSNDNVYFGLAATGSTDAEQVMPFFDPSKENTLEYDLTKLVYSLSNPKKLKIGLCSSLPVDGAMPTNPFGNPRDMPEPWVVVDQLRALFDVKNVPASAKTIDADIDVLLVVHPKNFSPTLQYAIDQFVLRGGRALVFVDPWCEVDEPMTDPQNPMARYTASRGSELNTLFSAWGVELAKDKLAADESKALKVTFPTSTGKTDSAPYVVWLGLDRENVNANEILTSDLKLLQVRSAGVLSKKADATTEFTPLLETTTDAMAVATSAIQFTQDPKKLLADFASEGKKLVLAARITGKVKSAFPDGPPPDEKADPDASPESEPKPAHLTESAEPIHVIVVSDVDMLTDATWVQVTRLGNMRIPMKRTDNGDFVFNAIDYMKGSTDMISLRSRGGMLRPFKRVEQLQREADQRFRAEEQRLQGELTKADQRWQELQSKKQGASSAFLSPEELTELQRVGEEKLATRGELRKVQLSLRKDVDRLGSWMQFFNVWLLPLMIVVFAVSLWFLKSRRPTAI
ncbi:MAG: GldG family protein [Planctomycetes bacterium]|nr:GldG family protein [Planctomycetota bacterium]